MIVELCGASRGASIKANVPGSVGAVRQGKAVLVVKRGVAGSGVIVKLGRPAVCQTRYTAFVVKRAVLRRGVAGKNCDASPERTHSLAWIIVEPGRPSAGTVEERRSPAGSWDSTAVTLQRRAVVVKDSAEGIRVVAEVRRAATIGGAVSCHSIVTKVGRIRIRIVLEDDASASSSDHNWI